MFTLQELASRFGEVVKRMKKYFRVIFDGIVFVIACLFVYAVCHRFWLPE